jgi:hypothetical protein
MNEIIAYCGLDCSQCGALIATETNDAAKRVEVAAMWSEEFNADIRPEHIYCDGCVSEGGVLYQHCSVCEIRKCGSDKGLANCGHCDEYPCIKLAEFFAVVPDAKTRLDGVRAGL